jgi:HEAT repeat protein
MWWFRKKDNVEKWIAKLKKRNPERRQKAVEALGNLKDTRAVEPLIRVLEQDVSFVRWKAAKVLGQIGDASAIAPLINALKDDDWDIRKNAAWALGRIGDTRAAAPLLELLGDPFNLLREAVIEALGTIGDPLAVEPLIKVLEEKDPSIRKHAVTALAMIGDPRAVEPLIGLLRDQDTEVRQKTIESLAILNDPRVVEPLITILGDKASHVQHKAVQALGEIRDVRAIEPLIKALGEEDAVLKQEAAEALIKIGRPAVDLLNKALREESFVIRYRTALVLDNMSWKPKDAVEYLYYLAAKQQRDIGALKELLDNVGRSSDEITVKSSSPAIKLCIEAFKSDNTDVQRHAAEILEKIGRPAIESLIQAFRHQNVSVRRNAARILEKISDPRAMDPFIKLFGTLSPLMQDQVLNILRDTGPSGITSLITTLEEKDYGVRNKVAVLLGAILSGSTKDDDYPIEALLNLLDKKNPVIPKNELIKILGKMGDPRIVERLIKALEQKDWDTRYEAIKALSTLGNVVIDPLMKALEDKSWLVRRGVLDVLWNISDDRAVTPLIKALEDSEADIRWKAASALEKRGWKPKNAHERIWYYIAKQRWEKLKLIGAPVVEPLQSVLEDRNSKFRLEAAGALNTIYTAIEVVLFGTPEYQEFERQTTLQNPDVSDFNIPMSHLEKIAISTETYNFHQVERFITYAVNYIGQEYLKNNVEVHIYDDPSKLHPNLRNSLENLCKCVEVNNYQ